MDEDDKFMCNLIAQYTCIFDVIVVVNPLFGVFSGAPLDFILKGMCAISLIGLFLIACIIGMGMEE